MWISERRTAYPTPEDVWEQAEADAAEKFGEDWPRASAILHDLTAETGIIMGDVHPGNLALRG